MLSKSTSVFLLLALFLAVSVPSKAQSLRGKVIYVSPNEEVRLKFRSAVENYSFVNKNEANLFTVNVHGGRSFVITSTGTYFRSANLVITEGENTHLFLLTFKNNLDAAETVYDYSSKEKLQSEAQRMATRPKIVKANTSVKQVPVQPAVTPAAQTIHTIDAAVKVDAPVPVKVEPPVQPPTTPVTQAVITDDAPIQASAPPVVQAVKKPEESKPQTTPPVIQTANKTDAPEQSTRLPVQVVTIPVAQPVNKVETKPVPSELDRKYADLVTLADKAFASRSFGEAGGLYTAALVLKPNDSWSVSRLTAIQNVRDSAARSASKQESNPGEPLYTKTATPASNAAEYKSDGPLYRNTSKTNKASDWKPGDPLYRPTAKTNASDRKSNQPLYRPTGKSGTADKGNAAGQTGGNAAPIQTSTPLVFDDYNLDSIRYDVFIQLADSLAWRAKDYQRALPWYDSALTVKPQASYPKKQIKAVKHLLAEKGESDARKQRATMFAYAMEDFRKADRLRVERRFEESYYGFSQFLSKIDTTTLVGYDSHDMYYINLAKDYVIRLKPYLPKPKVAAPPPVVDEGKKGKKKKRG